MSKRVKVSVDEKVKAVTRVLESGMSYNAEAKRIGVSDTTIKDWVRKYKTEGIERLNERKNWTRYSEELKLQAVKEVVENKKSLYEVVEVYAISSRSLLNNWISKYTGREKIPSTCKGSSKMKMTRGRKTEYKERIEIVEYTIAHKLAYEKAAEMYQVSYQQIYSWVRKYQTLGEEGLKDGRGRNKEWEELSEVDRLKLENKKLQAEKEQLEMEVAVQKKLQEIQKRFNR